MSLTSVSRLDDHVEPAVLAARRRALLSLTFGVHVRDPEVVFSTGCDPTQASDDKTVGGRAIIGPWTPARSSLD